MSLSINFNRGLKGMAEKLIQRPVQTGDIRMGRTCAYTETC